MVYKERCWFGDQNMFGSNASKAVQSKLGFPPVHGVSSSFNICTSPPILGVGGIRGSAEVDAGVGVAPDGVSGAGLPARGERMLKLKADILQNSHQA